MIDVRLPDTKTLKNPLEKKIGNVLCIEGLSALPLQMGPIICDVLLKALQRQINDCRFSTVHSNSRDTILQIPSQVTRNLCQVAALLNEERLCKS